MSPSDASIEKLEERLSRLVEVRQRSAVAPMEDLATILEGAKQENIRAASLVNKQENASYEICTARIGCSFNI